MKLTADTKRLYNHTLSAKRACQLQALFVRGILLLFFCCSLFQQASSQNLDINWLRRVHSETPRASGAFAKGISHSIYPISLSLPLSQGIYGLAKRDQQQQWNALSSTGAILLAGGLSSGLKLLVNRPRPYVTYSDITPHAHPGPYSFPSGHTAIAFATATSLTMAYPKWYVGVPAYAYAGFVAWSRMRLGVHYPTDLLAGMAIGIGSGLLMYKTQQWVR